MPSSKNKANVLYEDKYCKLTKTALIIKWYYFPTAHSKKIDIENIKGLYYKEQQSFADMFMLKGWGMSLSPCWWACDISRGLCNSDRFNIVLDVEDNSNMCGFSVADKEEFLTKVTVLLRQGCIVKHGPYQTEWVQEGDHL